MSYISRCVRCSVSLNEGDRRAGGNTGACYNCSRYVAMQAQNPGQPSRCIRCGRPMNEGDRQFAAQYGAYRSPSVCGTCH